MKLKLLISILLFASLFHTQAQDFKQSTGPRPVDLKYLSATDSLAIYSQLKMSNLANKKTLAGQAELPYPIIFVHGLDSNDKTWKVMNDFLRDTYSLISGGQINVCLNYDGDNFKTNTNIYPVSGADIAFFTDINSINVGDFYFVNFDINNIGGLYPSELLNTNYDNLSNESAIVKQGVALRTIINLVKSKTGKDKVILMGHSMGGLASREYLQNPNNWSERNVNHHVAKLITTGTPHGGYNGVNPFITTIESKSEAYRDLRKTYIYSSYVLGSIQYGVYLSGGVENATVIDNSISTDFYNVDINCNGFIGDNILGINQKNLNDDIDIAYIIGNNSHNDGDGVVESYDANLSNFYNLAQPKNEFYYLNDSFPIIHSELPKATPENMQGLDEPNEYNLAYGVQFGKKYTGFTTVQPIGGYPNDFDDYTFITTSTSQVKVDIANTSFVNLKVHILDSTGNPVGNSGSTNGANSISVTQTLPAGKYYLEIYGIPTTTSYLNPYSFTLTNTTLSTDDFELSTDIKMFPNPTTSKVFFDNSNHNFENVSIVNSLGQEVSKIKFTTFLNNQEIDMSDLTTGVYVLKFSNNEETKAVKVVKQ